MLQNPIIPIIKKVLPAVVSIVIAKRLEDVEKDARAALRSAKKKGVKKAAIPKELADADGMVRMGGGAGFFIDRSGLILTNKHVAGDRNAKYTIVMGDDVELPAEIVTVDPINDVAILRAGLGVGKIRHGYPAISLGDSAKLQLGESVIAIGNALGLFQNTVSLGIISGLSRAVTAQTDSKSPAHEMRGLIQTDAAINPGNSGGPLVDMNGHAIGINTAVIFNAQSIGFAIPINAAKRDLRDLKTYGRIRRPFLGVRYLMIDKKLKERMKLPVAYGALVIHESPHDRGVIPQSPADKAGIRENDIILSFAGKPVGRNVAIQDVLENLSVGVRVPVRLLRDGKELTKNVTLTERV